MSSYNSRYNAPLHLYRFASNLLYRCGWSG